MTLLPSHKMFPSLKKDTSTIYVSTPEDTLTQEDLPLSMILLQVMLLLKKRHRPHKFLIKKFIPPYLEDASTLKAYTPEEPNTLEARIYREAPNLETPNTEEAFHIDVHLAYDVCMRFLLSVINEVHD